jgi:hypothetical protein
MRNFIAPEIDYDAPQHVRDAVVALGRTEDVKFSPSNRRMAVAGFGDARLLFSVFPSPPRDLQKASR